MSDRYELVGDNAYFANGIRCLACGLTSWNPADVAQRYCGKCHIFHDDAARSAGNRIGEQEVLRRLGYPERVIQPPYPHASRRKTLLARKGGRLIQERYPHLISDHEGWQRMLGVYDLSLAQSERWWHRFTDWIWR